MTLKRLSLNSPLGFVSIYIFSICLEINYKISIDILSSKGMTTNELESLEIYEFFWHIIASLFLIPLIKVKDFNKVFMITLTIVFINILNINYFEIHKLLKVYFLMASTASYIYLTFIFINLFEAASKKLNFLIIFIITFGAGYLSAINLISLSYRSYQEPNYIFSLLLLFFLIYFHYFLPLNWRTKNVTSNFFIIFTAIETELFSGMLLAYVLSSSYWWYEIIALLKNFPITQTNILKSYLIFSMIGGLIPLTIFLIRFPYSILILGSFIILLFNYLFILPFATNLYLNIFLISSLSICLICIFICNLLHLSLKFDKINLKIALALYLIALMLGAYSGPVATDAAVDAWGEKGFVISICFNLCLFITYYSYYFFKNKLYRSI